MSLSPHQASLPYRHRPHSAAKMRPCENSRPKKRTLKMLAPGSKYLLLAVLAVPAHAQTVPDAGSKPVRMIVGFLPGSSNDTLARFVSSKLQERLGQQFV